jgi:hypothetical protein
MAERWGMPLCACLERDYVLRRAYHARDRAGRVIEGRNDAVVAYAMRLLPETAKELCGMAWAERKGCGCEECACVLWRA